MTKTYNELIEEVINKEVDKLVIKLKSMMLDKMYTINDLSNAYVENYYVDQTIALLIYHNLLNLGYESVLLTKDDVGVIDEATSGFNYIVRIYSIKSFSKIKGVDELSKDFHKACSVNDDYYYRLNKHISSINELANKDDEYGKFDYVIVSDNKKDLIELLGILGDLYNIDSHVIKKSNTVGYSTVSGNDMDYELPLTHSYYTLIITILKSAYWLQKN